MRSSTSSESWEESEQTYNMRESIAQRNVTEKDIQEAEKLELDVQTILRLVDLIFLCREEGKDIPS